MIMRSSIVVFLLTVVSPALSLIADDVAPQTAGAFSASRRVMIVSSETEVFAGDEAVGRIPPGSIVDYLQENGEFLLVPRYNGWIDRKHAVPVEGALEYCNQLVASDGSSLAYHFRGIAHAEAGNLREAWDDFNEAINQGLTEASVYINRGIIAQKAGSLDMALADYTKAIELEPNSVFAWHNRAIVRAELGQWAESLADSAEAIRINPNFAEAYNARGQTFQMHGDLEEAEADFTKATELFPTFSAAYANRGLTRVLRKNYAGAIEDYYQAIRLTPDSAVLLNDTAWVLATCPEIEFCNGDHAVELAQRACELTEHKEFDFLDTLATAYARQENWQEAIRWEQQAISLAPEEAKPELEARLRLFQQTRPFTETAD
jgi:tetratricopeptide (TPR) repeat protein